MEITEKDLEDLIFDDLKQGGHYLYARGFRSILTGGFNVNKVYLYRQVSLKSYGIADIIGFTRYKGVIEIDLIELKNRPLKAEDFDQIYRYKKAIQTIIKNSFKTTPRYKIKPTLVGPGFESGHYIQNNCDCSVIEFSFSIRGFQFTVHEGEWFNTGFKNTAIRDITCPNEYVIPGICSVKVIQETADNGQEVH